MKPRFLKVFKLLDPLINKQISTSDWMYLNVKNKNFQSIEVLLLITFLAKY